MEFVRDLAGIEGRFGITTVYPNRAVRKCRIRSMRIEYFQSETAVTLVVPKPCGLCEKGDECSDDFILQIMEKNKSKGTDFGVVPF